MLVLRSSVALYVSLAAIAATAPFANFGGAGAGRLLEPGFVAVLTAPHARPQVPDTQLVDGLVVLEAARDAQRAFERTRRRNLPFWNGPTGRCDEIVGRFCVWHERDPSWNPGPESPRVKVAREELIQLLERYARATPGEGWIVGQWVRYLVEAGRAEEAQTAAGACAAERWWCLALTAYARHALADFSGADEAYETALRAMPSMENCRWRDLSYILDGETLNDYEDLDCGERLAFETRAWWLADPLLMVPGNERRTEHFSRNVLNRLQLGADSPYGVHWGPDLEELLVRYGWPVRWSRRREPAYSPGRQRPSISGHDPDRSFRFFPPSELMSEFTTLEVAWELEPRRPREEYQPPYAVAFDGLEQGFDHQLAVFRRGGSALVVGAYEWATDSLPPATPLRVGLVYSAEQGRPEVAIAEGAPRRGVLTKRTRAEPGVLGIEALAIAAGRAARVRVGRRLSTSTGQPSISDIILLEPGLGEPAPGTLEEALRFVRPSTTVRRGERVGLLWELYGVAERTPLEVEVSLTKPGKGFFRRAAEWLGLAKDDDSTVSLEWREQTGRGSGPASRYVELRIPDLAEGRYVLSASVRLARGTELTSARVLTVRR
jgi:hypothetical protein